MVNNSMTQNIGLSKHTELHTDKSGSKLNWLRASVLGANDGIVSVASIVVGVAGASSQSGFILTAGVPGLVAGALSMAVGEYVSVSTQRDTEKALLVKERYELQNNPQEEVAELVQIYTAKGLSEPTARMVAQELTAHVDAELGIDPNNLTNPWHAAFASAGAFLSGAIIPLVAIVLPPPSIRLFVTFAAVVVALALTGTVSAHVGGANKVRATVRVVAGGVVAMLVTYGIGKLVGGVGL